MKLKESKKLIQPFIDQCEKDNDCYLIFHFSREEDKYYGLPKMDAGDALIVINNLVKSYGLNLEVIINSIKL